MPCDFNGASLAKVDDEICFRQARPGDHLQLPESEHLREVD